MLRPTAPLAEGERLPLHLLSLPEGRPVAALAQDVGKLAVQRGRAR